MRGRNTKYEIRNTNEESAPNSYLESRISYLGLPVSRDTLAALSGVCARSQAAYERRAGVAARPNYALGERVAASAPAGPAEQERAWQLGRALFRLRDHRGLHGRPGATYLAWRLPNAYGAARGHQPRPKGQQKRINRQLADLFMKGMTGNGAATIERRFFGNAKEITNYELRMTNEEQQARSSRAARPATTTRHWPLAAAPDGSGRGGCAVWGTLEEKHGIRDTRYG